MDSIRANLNKLMFYSEKEKEDEYKADIDQVYNGSSSDHSRDMNSLNAIYNKKRNEKYINIRKELNGEEGEGDRIFKDILDQLPEIETTIREKKEAYETLNSGNNKPNIAQKGMKMLGIPTKIDKVYRDIESIGNEIRTLESVKRDIEILIPIYKDTASEPRGGKRKTRRNRKSKKSRNNQKKHTIKKYHKSRVF